MDKANFTNAVLQFLRRNNPEKPFDSIPTDENLFNIGMLESFSIPSLAMYLEKISQKKLPMENITIEAFYSIDSMFELLQVSYNENL